MGKELNCSDHRTMDSKSEDIVQKIFHRRIDFHLARKTYSCFPNTSDLKLETLNPSPTDAPLPGALANPGPSLSSPSMKPDAHDLKENGLDPELSRRITFRRIGAGLANLGNTCFLNSVLQCLTYTEPLVAYLQSGKHQTSCHIIGFCALCAIQRHVSRALQSTGRILAPNDLVSNLRCISRNFRNARQEDAHEYMIHLLESMHKCCLPSGVPTESPSAYEKSLVHKIFGGRLQSQVKCVQCSSCSNKFDPFLDLSLEIVKADSLYKALMHFTATEHLDGGERQYQCDRCKQKVKALKQLTIHKAPYVLTIHLKRFGLLTAGQKIEKKVHFGPTLDLKPFVSSSYPEGDLMYTLYGVLVHAGWSTDSGHYYCFVRTSTGMWYSLDDNRVIQVNERTVLDQKAYMLFYVRDRENFSPERPANVAHKANILAANVKTVSCTTGPTSRGIQNGYAEKLVRERIQNDLLPKLIGNLYASDVLVQKSKLNICSSNESLPKPEFVRKCNGAVSSECSDLIKEKVSVSQSDVAGMEQTTKSCDNSLADINATKVLTCDNVYTEDKSSRSDLVSVAKASNFAALPSITVDVASKASQKGSMGADTKVCSSPMSDSGGELTMKVDPHKQTNQLNDGSQIHKTGIAFKEESAEPSPSDQSVLGKFPSLVNMDEHLRVAASDVVSQRKLKKLKKCKIASLYVGTKMLYRASLCSRKRKKGKKVKLCNQNLVLEHLDDDRISTDLGPSTSGRTTSFSMGSSAHSHTVSDSGSKQGHNHAAEKDMINCSGNLQMQNVNGEFKERTAQRNTALGTYQHSLKSSSSLVVANQLDTGKPIGSKDSKNCQVHNGMTNGLTMGLVDPAVAHWDGIELPSSQILESNGSDNISIGYMLDEWDEEYDRGKRKKVKMSRNSYGGPNPFQEIASMKAKLKTSKTQIG
ncbi:hypothetical protein Nepgr_006300 [Nepenthes gracilis]|uniref:Ubiquitin carboxyl-terminal hydrolase n=1 Tax=Nepenthes gracilis TaxID=150966 RepID=A0AAD3S550_NEPGR|nr:hypothetical protein Nepgr_006300 [Nepenthes gracilis]